MEKHRTYILIWTLILLGSALACVTVKPQETAPALTSVIPSATATSLRLTTPVPAAPATATLEPTMTRMPLTVTTALPTLTLTPTILSESTVLDLDAGLALSTVHLREGNDLVVYDVRYPQLQGVTTPAITQINSLIQETIQPEIAETLAQNGYGLFIDYRVAGYVNGWLSIEFWVSHTSGAHSATRPLTLNTNLHTGEPLTLDMILETKDSYAVLEGLVTAQLRATSAGLLPAAGYSVSTKSWGFSPEGLTVSFASCELAPCAAGGATQVTVPYSDVQDILASGIPLWGYIP